MIFHTLPKKCEHNSDVLIYLQSVLASQNPKGREYTAFIKPPPGIYQKSSHFSTAHSEKHHRNVPPSSYTWKHETQTSRESSLSMSHYSWPSVCEWTMGIKRKTILLLQLGSGSGKPLLLCLPDAFSLLADRHFIFSSPPTAKYCAGCLSKTTKTKPILQLNTSYCQKIIKRKRHTPSSRYISRFKQKDCRVSLHNLIKRPSRSRGHSEISSC